MMGKYLLDKDHKPYLVEDTLEWGKEFMKNRRVALYEEGAIRVSTVFLGLDHNYFGEGPPILFETMVFDEAEGPMDQTMERCSTWKQAEIQHKKIVRRVKQIITLESIKADAKTCIK